MRCAANDGAPDTIYVVYSVHRARHSALPVLLTSLYSACLLSEAILSLLLDIKTN